MGRTPSAYTIKYGAGRRMSRTAAKKQLDPRAVDSDYRKAGIVVNLDRRVPIEESGAAYKSSMSVIAVMLVRHADGAATMNPARSAGRVLASRYVFRTDTSCGGTMRGRLLCGHSSGGFHD